MLYVFEPDGTMHINSVLTDIYEHVELDALLLVLGICFIVDQSHRILASLRQVFYIVRLVRQIVHLAHTRLFIVLCST